MIEDSPQSRSPGYRYVVYGIAIDCDVPLRELDALPEPSPLLFPENLRVRLGAPQLRVAEPREWLLQTSLPDGQPWLWVARDDRGLLLRYVGLADFLAEADGAAIALVHADAASSRDTLAHLLLDQALPIVLGLRGIPALHASTVITPAGACAFLGASGAGKSTLAASFATAGYAALGDDCLALSEDDGIRVIPAYPGLRLRTDSAQALAIDWANAPAVAHFNRKRRVASAPPAELFAPRGAPLAAIYCLERDSAGDAVNASASPSIEALPANEAFVQLLGASFVVDISDRAAVTRNLRFIERLLRGVAIRRLRISHRYSELTAVRELVLNDLAAIGREAIAFARRKTSPRAP